MLSTTTPLTAAPDSLHSGRAERLQHRCDLRRLEQVNKQLKLFLILLIGSSEARMVPALQAACGGFALSSRTTCLTGPIIPSMGTAAVPWPTQLLATRSLQQLQQHSRHGSSCIVAAAGDSALADNSQKRVRRTRAAPGSSSSAGGGSRRQSDADMDVEDYFMDPLEAKKLRRMAKQKGLQAVVDDEGFVKVPVSDTAAEPVTRPPAARRDSSSSSAPPSSSTHSAAAAAAADPVENQQQQQQQQQQQREGDISSSDSSSRSRLFSKSQLQPAAPGSGGNAPALPIVRPSSSSSSSISSSSRRDQDSSSRDRGRSSAGSYAAARGSSSSSGAAFFSSKSWESLHATPELIAALQTVGVTKPSHIQAEAFKALSPKSGLRHVALADQAGSGKTLAYLLPLLQQLKQKEAAAGAPATRANSPSIIVMAPTTELAQQVGRVVRALSGAGLRVRCAVMTGGQSEADRRSKTFRTQCELLDGGLDVLVATPGRLLSHLEKGSLSLQHTAALVMDEVDVLAGGEVSYAEHIAPLHAAGSADLRCVLVSATLPQHTFDELQEMFMGLGAAFGPGLHRTATGCIEELVDCSGGDEISLESGTQRKLEAMVDALDRVRSLRTLVFCNKIETCRVVENALKRRDDAYQVMAYHEAIREEARAASLQTWLSPPTPSQPPMVLVCTDRTSRGIDSMWCEHVVLFEFPRDPSEYVRRVGRTARGAGGRGVVTVLVLGKQVALAKDILARNKAGAPVHRVPRLFNE
ncbi:P-loop containing nucleoside triphosphate hydrolase protein [Scenedesmus sp. NREL 46B-D3]|nr:P-loop containing nucleoside triphosphate hydrolase protein [Scenedesmus sp. NREL 46B-D3]